jgi:hypothetical protein
MMLLSGENEVQAHQFYLHRKGLTPAAIAVAFLPDGRKKRLGSHVRDLRTIG